MPGPGLMLNPARQPPLSGGLLSAGCEPRPHPMNSHHCGDRAVIAWLNAHTPPEYAFFGIEVSAVRIADSPVAPVFTVVEKPNSWVRQSSNKVGPTARKLVSGIETFGMLLSPKIKSLKATILRG